jgi:hypothetical protein
MAIQSLFGPSVADVQELRRRQAEQEIAGAGQEFGVFAPLYQAGLRFGGQAARGINTLMGVQDPMLKKATDIQSVLSKYQGQDLTSSDTLKNISGELASLGYANESLMTAQEAQQAAAREATLRKAATEERKALLSQAQELQLRQELAALGPNATEDQVLSVVTKYGTPDKILAALTSAQARRSQQDLQRSIADQRLDIQRQNLDLRRDIQDTKIAEKDEKKQASAEGALANAGRVIQTVGEAKQLVTPFTTGIGGYLAVLPATDARKLKNKIETIKANLGFDRLQQMRDASPTGGALGQVAVREIDFLQATVATLDQLESSSDITAALNKIEEHYSNWKTALEGKVPAKYQQGGGQAAVPSAPVTPAAVPAAVTVPAGVTVKKVRD